MTRLTMLSPRGAAAARFVVLAWVALFMASASAQTQATNLPVLVADFNQDGIPDLLALSTTAPTATVAFGTLPYGSFSGAVKAVSFPAACTGFVGDAVNFGNLLAGDFNGDGFPDLFFVCNTAGGTLTGVLPGIGDGTFGAAVTLSTGVVNGGVLGDFNRDGKLDVVVLAYPNGLQGNGAQQPSLLLFSGRGDGTFAQPVSSPLGASSTFQPGNFILSSPVAADVNGDGYPDIVLNAAYGYSPTNYNGATLTISVFGNKTDGTFGVATQGLRVPDVTAAAGTYPASLDLKVLAGNIFGSGLPDFAVPDSAAAPGIFVIKNTSTATTFSLAAAVKTPYAGLTAAMSGNVTGRGFMDLIVANSTKLTVLANDGAGNFAANYSALALTSATPTFAIADANGDGYADVYTASQSGDATQLGVSLVTGSASATSAPFALGLGTKAASAAWAGSVSLAGSMASGTQVVNGTATTSSVTSSKNPSTVGDAVTFTATVAPALTTTMVPTGTVSFRDGTTTLGSGSLDGTGKAMFTTSSLTAATHTIQAIYGGDNYFAGGNSTALSQVVTRSAALAPTLSWATPAPIASGTALGGAQLNAVATNATGGAVAGTYVYTPAAGTILSVGPHTLSVTFMPTDTTTYTTATQTVLLTVLPQSQTPLTSNLLLNPGAELGSIQYWTAGGPGSPTVDTGTFDAGINPHTGTYDFVGLSGASDSLSQTVSLLSQSVTAALLDSGTVYASLSFWEQGLSQGTPSDDASVTLTFLDGSGNTLSSVNSGEIDSHNNVWQNFSNSYALPVGTRSITYTMNFIRHAGSDLDAFVDDNSLLLSVAGANTSATTLTVTSGGNAVTTVASGSVVTLTATVTAGTARVTTGQINFCDTTASLCTDIHLLGTAQLTSAGSATLKFIPGIGAYSYKAVFLGTPAALTASSAASTLTVTAAGKYPTTTAIAQSGATGNYTLTATVTGIGGSILPTGAVSFVDTTSANAVLKTGALGSAQASLTFSNASNPATGSGPINVVPADLNGDGKKDLLVGNSASNTISVLLGNGDGTFTAAANVNTGRYPSSIAVGDFNGDGKPDIAVTNFYDNTVLILLGNGDGTFAAGSTVATGTDTRTITTADFNRDGKLDLAIGHDNTVLILLGNGDGTFTTGATLTTGNGPNYGIASGDFNGDGIPDIATTDAYENTLTILLGNGDGTFTVSSKPATGATPVALAIGDVNGDGKLDIVVADQADNNVSILLGQSDGTFAYPTQPSAGTNPQGVSIGDLNGDGIPDLAVANQDSNTVSILLGKGDGTFTLIASPATGTSPDRAAIADFNGDGVPDIATTNVSGANLTILLTQLTQTATATAANINPIGGGAHQVTASYPGDANYAASVSPATTLTGTRTTPTITWATPANIALGTPLSATQLNATASGVNGVALPGVFVYTPPAGTVLALGTQTLSVTFTPTDTVSYTTASATVRITVTSTALTSITPNTANLGDPAKTITATGLGFDTTSVVQVNNVAVPTTYVNATTLSALIPAANFKAVGTLQVTVTNASNQTVTAPLPLTVVNANPTVTLSAPTTTAPGSQPAVALTIVNPYPIALTATFNLSFASAVTPAVDDPAIQFANGGRTLTFTVAANSTTVPPIQLQAGTVAGTITIPLTLTANGANVTPTTVQPVTIVIPRAIPVVSTTTVTRPTGQLSVAIHGFSNTREVTTATFHFVAAPGATINTPDIVAPVTTLFNGWFGSATSTPFGSTFTYTQVFNVSDDPANIASVQVTLTNSVGTSILVTAQ